MSVYDPELPAHSGTMHRALDKAREATSIDLPFHRLQRAEDERERRGDDQSSGVTWDAYDSLQHRVGLRSFFRYLIVDGIDPWQVMSRLWSVGEWLGLDRFVLRGRQHRMMIGEERRSIAWRVRVLFGRGATNPREALASFAERAGYVSPGDIRFDDLLLAEPDGLDTPPGEDEIRLRRTAVRAVIQYLARDTKPTMPLSRLGLRVMRELWTFGRGLHFEPFASMTMAEAGGMLDETKSNHSYRGKRLSELIERAGMKGSRLPRQKTKAASKSYAETAKRTCNRRAA